MKSFQVLAECLMNLISRCPIDDLELLFDSSHEPEEPILLKCFKFSNE